MQISSNKSAISGAWKLSTVYMGIFCHCDYFGYTLKEAKKVFRLYVKGSVQ